MERIMTMSMCKWIYLSNLLHQFFLFDYSLLFLLFLPDWFGIGLSLCERRSKHGIHVLHSSKSVPNKINPTSNIQNAKHDVLLHRAEGISQRRPSSRLRKVGTHEFISSAVILSLTQTLGLFCFSGLCIPQLLARHLRWSGWKLETHAIPFPPSLLLSVNHDIQTHSPSSSPLASTEALNPDQNKSILLDHHHTLLM